MSKIEDELMKGLRLTPEQREKAAAYSGNISHSAATPAQPKADDSARTALTPQEL